MEIEQSYRLFVKKNEEFVKKTDKKIKDIDHKIGINNANKEYFEAMLHNLNEKKYNFKEFVILLALWTAFGSFIYIGGISKGLTDLFIYLILSAGTCVRWAVKQKKLDKENELLKNANAELELMEIDEKFLKQEIIYIDMANERLETKEKWLLESKEEIANAIDLIKIYFETKSEMDCVKSNINQSVAFKEYLQEQALLEEKAKNMQSIDEFASERVDPSKVHFVDKPFMLELVNKNK